MDTAISLGIASTTETVIDILTTNIPVVMAVFAGLVALGIALKLVGRLIGRKA